MDSVVRQRADRGGDAAGAERMYGRTVPGAGAVSSDAEAPRRLLVPIDATERSRWPLRYVLTRREQPLHVDLLFVGPPVTSLEVLRFRTQAEVAAFQARCAQWLLQDAAQPLAEAGLSVRSHFREGDVAREIVETAEQLGAEAIVMPPAHPLWLNFLTRGIVRKVLRLARAIPVLHVDADGRPVAVPAAIVAR
jgi:nucleotide-binding universal stress UspA family protein